MIQSLVNIEERKHVKVVSLGKKGSVFRKKLLSMGLTPGTQVSILRKAPLGGPLELSLRGFSLSLRQSEARGIRVELMNEAS